MSKKKLKFPKNFLWGVSTSSYQIEGNNSNSDWWEWEKAGKTKEKSGQACDYFNRFREDHNFLQELKCNSFRVSIEWSRVEPEENFFSAEAINHYRDVLQDLKKKEIKTVVTFWHWTSPIWFQKKYGFHRKESREIFFRYGKKIIDELGDLIDIIVTINEPMMPLNFGFLLGKFPPGKMNWIAYRKAEKNLSESHKKIYLYSKEKDKKIPVGVTLLYNFFEPNNKKNFLDRWIVLFLKKIWNDSFAQKINGYADYIGLDYYFHNKISFLGRKNENKKVVDVMGWEIYPEGIYEVLKEIKEKYNLPIYVMENGLPDAKDKLRKDFIKDHLKFIHKAIEENVDVKGYFYWSLMDNYEWLWGYNPRFGLVEINYENFKRHPRKSFYEYAKICRENGVEI